MTWAKRSRQRRVRGTSSGFNHWFPRLASLLSTMWIVMGIAILAMIVAGEREEPSLTHGSSLLAHLGARHGVVYTCSFLLLSLVALIASLGYRRRWLWALRAWVGLCWLGIVLPVAWIGAETFYQLGLIPGVAPSVPAGESLLPILFVTGVLAVGIPVLLLRRLTSPSTKRHFEA